MKTKNKILKTALLLFNTYEIGQVSSLMISQELNISYGNLTYHFKKKKDIVIALYEELQGKVDTLFGEIVQKVIAQQFDLYYIQDLFKLQLEYRFFYSAYTEILIQNPTIYTSEQSYFTTRQAILQGLLKQFTVVGFIHPATIPQQHNRLVHALIFFFNSWVADSNFFYKGLPEKKVLYYTNVFLSMIFPMLTEVCLQTDMGKKMLEQLKNSAINFP